MHISRREFGQLAGVFAATLGAGTMAKGQEYPAAENVISKSTAEFFFSGSHGGFVTYDGKGGPLMKEGGPIDRVFLLRKREFSLSLGGDVGFDIYQGTVRIRTGPLSRDVTIEKKKGEDTLVRFYFKENEDEDSIQIKGGVPELGLANGTVLFHGSTEPAEMVWMVGDVTGKQPMLPFIALHRNFNLHPAFLRRFGLQNKPRLALTAWCKIPPDFKLEQVTKKGFAFKTEQHLANLRVFV